MWGRLALIVVVYTVGVLTAPRSVLEAREQAIDKLIKRKDALVSNVEKG